MAIEATVELRKSTKNKVLFFIIRCVFEVWKWQISSANLLFRGYLKSIVIKVVKE